MDKKEIKNIIEKIEESKDRNLVIIDFSNLVHWQDNLKWKIGIKELRKLIKHFVKSKKYLRRFYYGSDFGPKDDSEKLTVWSEMVHKKAEMNNFEIITKRVKYINDKNYKDGYVKKCDLDIEMAIDMIKEESNYDNIILFSGDGDLACVLRYLNEKFNKHAYIFTARNHLGKELLQCKYDKIVKEILFVEDFEYRLNMNRFRL